MSMNLRTDKKKNPSLKKLGFHKERRRTEPEGRTRRTDKKKNPSLKKLGFQKERRRHTLPQTAVPSAQGGLTSLLGRGRGGPRRNNHLKSFCNGHSFRKERHYTIS